MYYINYFFIFSILGHILESFFYSGSSTSGILYGPYTPVYGFGVCIIILFYHFIKKGKTSKFLKVFYIFLLGFLGLTILEFIGGIFIEKVFHVIFWDYSHLKFHIGHYIALEVSLVWGICSLIVAYIIRPFCDKWITKIPKFISYFFIIIILIDFMATLFFKILF